MTEEVAHGGIGLDFKFSGMSELQKLTQEIDKVKHNFADISGGMDRLNGVSSHMGTNIGNQFKTLDDKTEQWRRQISSTIDTVNHLNNSRLSEIDNRFSRLNSLVKEVNSSTKSMRDTMDRMPTEKINQLGSSFRRAGTDVKHSGNEAKEANGHFKRIRDTMLGTFAGNAISNGLSSLGSNLFSLTKQGLQFDAAAQDISKHWREAGLTAGQSNAMVKQLSEIRQHADISAGAITAMQKQYLTLTGSATQARELTSSITAFGKESGMNEDQQSRVARLIASNKTVNARTFNRTLGQAPAFANEIIKQTGMSKNAFYDLLQSGKITGQQLRNAMIKASKDSNKAWSDYAKTSTGKVDMINATYKNVRKTFSQKLAGGIFDQLNKAAKGNNLNKLQKQVEGIAKSAGEIVGSGIGKVVGFLVKNKDSLAQLGKAVWNIVKGLASGAWSAITTPLKLISGHSKQGSKGLQGIANAMTAISKHQGVLKAVGASMVGIFAFSKFAKTVIFVNKFIKAIKELGIISKAVAVAQKAFAAAQWALNTAMASNPIGGIIAGITALGIIIYEVYKRFKPFRKIVNGTFKVIKKAVSGWWKQVKRNFRAVTRVIGTFAKFIRKHFGNVIKNEMRTAKHVFKAIEDVIRVFKDVFTLNFKDLGKVIPKLARDLWKTVKGIWKSGADFVVDIGKTMWNSIWKTFKSWGKSIGKFFVDLWDGIKRSVSNGINDVTGVINTGIKGLNWVLSKVGGSGHTIGLIPKVHLAKGTFDGKLPRTTMAMLNDGHDSPQTGNREMAILPNGRAFIPQKRNWTGILPKGTMVLNATQTRELMQMHGIEHYSLGSFAHGLWNGAKHLGSNVVSGFKKTASAIAHPIKFLKGLFGGLPSMPEYMAKLTGGMANTAKNSIVSWFKKFFGGMNNPAGSGVQRWRSVIERAGAFMHEGLSGGDINLILGRIAKESGGNPTIRQQISDVNSASGHPAQGLLQYVPSTFASWAVRGHTNLLNGFDQLLAMFNDSNWRSDIANSGGWGPSGHRARRNGGNVDKDKWYQVNEAGFEMFKPKVDGKVLNHEDSKRTISGSSRPIEVNAPLTVNVSGDAKDLDKKLHDSYEAHTRELAEKINQLLGTSEGGYIL